VKKGRHRRFEEARALKRLSDAPIVEPCDECGARADETCASWCLARIPDDEFDEEFDDDRAEYDRADYEPSSSSAASASGSEPSTASSSASN
jgi:hypothetical protein